MGWSHAERSERSLAAPSEAQAVPPSPPTTTAKRWQEPPPLRQWPLEVSSPNDASRARQSFCEEGNDESLSLSPFLPSLLIPRVGERTTRSR